MNMQSLVRSASLVALLVVPSTLWGQAAGSGSEGTLGIGYVVNAPDMIVGGTVWGIIPGLGGWGLYVDGKMDPTDRTSDPYYRADLTPAEVAVQFPNDQEAEREERWRAFNVALVRSITAELALYAGGGYAYRDVYVRFLDPQRDRGQFGFYWVPDEAEGGGKVNVLGGVLLRASRRIRLQFGAEAVPRGFTVGLSVVLGGH